MNFKLRHIIKGGAVLLVFLLFITGPCSVGESINDIVYIDNSKPTSNQTQCSTNPIEVEDNISKIEIKKYTPLLPSNKEKFYYKTQINFSENIRILTINSTSPVPLYILYKNIKVHFYL